MATKNLLHFDATPFTDDSGATVTSSGSPTRETTITKFGAGSLSCFTGGRVGVPNTITTGDFTFEGWYYMGSTTTNFQFLGSFGTEGTNRQAWGIYSGNICIDNYGVGIYVNFGAPFSTGGWHHVALVRSGTNLMCFVDGNQLGSTYSFGSGSFGNSGNLIVGADSNGISPFLGYIDEWRVSDTAVYTSNFTPPSSAFSYAVAPVGTISATAPKPSDSIAAAVVTGGTISKTAPRPTASITGKLPLATLLHMDSDFGSNGGSLGSWTASGTTVPTISSLQSKFGGSSGLFGGGYLNIAANSQTNFGDSSYGDWTIETWFRISSFTSRTNHVFSFDTSSTSRMNCFVTSAGQLYFFASTGGVDTFPLNTSTGAVSLNTWTHVAIVRSGTTYQLFVNGTSIGTSTAYTLPPGNLNLHIGASPANSDPTLDFYGNIDEFRIARRAVYTANFTPATVAYTADEAASTTVTGTITKTAARPTASVASAHGIAGTISKTAPRPSAAVSGRVRAQGTINVTARTRPTAIVSSNVVDFAGTISKSAPRPTSVFSSSVVDYAGTITKTSARPTAVVSAVVVPRGSAAVTAARPTASVGLYHTQVYTKSLIHFDSSLTSDDVSGNTLSLPLDGGGILQSPTIDTTNKKFGGGSMKFGSNTNGYSGVKVSFASYTDIATAPFTFETWVYFSADSNIPIFSVGSPGSGTNYWYFTLGTTATGTNAGVSASMFTSSGIGNFSFISSSGTSNTAAALNNAWHHVAFVRYNGQIKFYVDGVFTGSAKSLTDGTALPADATLFVIGNELDSTGTSSAQPKNVSFDEVRISNTARYTSAFTPSTSAFSVEGTIPVGTATASAPRPTAVVQAKRGVTASVSATAARPTAAVNLAYLTPILSVSASNKRPKVTALGQQFGVKDAYLYHFDNLSATSAYTLQWTSFGGSLTTAKSKFGNGSYDSHNGALAMNPGATFIGDMTAEGWFLFDATKSTANTGSNVAQYLFSFGSAFTTFRMDTDGTISVGATNLGTHPSYTDGAWHHMAFVRKDGAIKCYVDGTQIGSSAAISGDLSGGAGNLFLGGQASVSSTSVWLGWIDEVRIAYYAAYTSNFTAPTTVFPTDSGASYVWGIVQPTAPRPTASLPGSYYHNYGPIAATAPRPISSTNLNHIAYAPQFSVVAAKPAAVVQSRRGVASSVTASARRPNALVNAPTQLYVAISNLAPKPNANVQLREGAKVTSITSTLGRPSAHVDAFFALRRTNFQGWMGETIVVNRPVTTDERQRLEGYLAWKWHHPEILPDTHPYRWDAPSRNFIPPQYVKATITAAKPTAAFTGAQPRPFIAGWPGKPTAAAQGVHGVGVSAAPRPPRPTVVSASKIGNRLSLATRTNAPLTSIPLRFGPTTTVATIAQRPQSVNVQSRHGIRSTAFTASPARPVAALAGLGNTIRGSSTVSAPRPNSNVQTRTVGYNDTVLFLKPLNSSLPNYAGYPLDSYEFDVNTSSSVTHVNWHKYQNGGFIFYNNDIFNMGAGDFTLEFDIQKVISGPLVVDTSGSHYLIQLGNDMTAPLSGLCINYSTGKLAFAGDVSSNSNERNWGFTDYQYNLLDGNIHRITIDRCSDNNHEMNIYVDGLLARFRTSTENINLTGYGAGMFFLRSSSGSTSTSWQGNLHGVRIVRGWSLYGGIPDGTARKNAIMKTWTIPTP